MFKHCLIVFLVIPWCPSSGLRGAIPYSVGWSAAVAPAAISMPLGNMLPVPLIYFLPGILGGGRISPSSEKFFTFCTGKREKKGD